MCSSCGQKAARLRTPGGNPRNPVLFGARDKRTAQPATFLEAYGAKKVGEYGYVAGADVEAAVESGVIALGIAAVPEQPAVPRLVPNRNTSRSTGEAFYVAIAPGQWKMFRNRASAERYAATRGVPVQTRDETTAAMNAAKEARS